MAVGIGNLRVQGKGAVGCDDDLMAGNGAARTLDQGSSSFMNGGVARTAGMPAMPGGGLPFNPSLTGMGLQPGATDPEMQRGLQALQSALGLDPNAPFDLKKVTDAIQNSDPIGKMRQLGLNPGDTLDDPKTVDAIKQLQEAAGINPTGKLDLETLMAILESAQAKQGGGAARQPSAGSSSGGAGSSAGNEGGIQGVSRRQAPGPQTPGLGRRVLQGAEDAVGIPSGSLSANQKEAYKAAIAGDPAHGVQPMSPTAARALVANMSGESLSKPNDNHWDVRHMSQGIVQWDPSRSAAIKAEFGKEPKDMTVAEQTHAAMWEISHNSRFSQTKSALYGGSDPNAMMSALVRNYEAPANPSGEINKRMGFYNQLGSLTA